MRNEITHRKLAESLGLHASTVSRDVRRGMPTTSAEAATEWRANHVRTYTVFRPPEPEPSEYDLGVDDGWREAYLAVKNFAKRDFARHAAAVFCIADAMPESALEQVGFDPTFDDHPAYDAAFEEYERLVEGRAE